MDLSISGKHCFDYVYRLVESDGYRPIWKPAISEEMDQKIMVLVRQTYVIGFVCHETR